MEAEDYSGCAFSLFCQEDGAAVLDDGAVVDDDDDDGELLLLCNAADDEEEVKYMEQLVSKESSFCSFTSSSSSASSAFSDAAGEASPMASEDWFMCVRRSTMKWILETRGCFGFCHRTVYLAIAYFDRFCLRRCIDKRMVPWAARLLAVACVSLAAKMEEYQPPALSEFRFDDYEFSCVSIRRMELFVLSTLAWRMNAVTPLDYLPCFSSALRRHHGGTGGDALIAVKAVAFIFSVTEVATVLDYRPSTVAAAAILAATYGTLSKETLASKMSNLSQSCLPEEEDVYACYNLMIKESNKRAKRSLACSDSIDIDIASSTYDSLDNADAASCAASPAASNKRMRLELPSIR